jgi:hypothetical protein
MIWRSVGAVFAGILFTIVVTTIVDVVLHLAGVYPPGQPIDDKLAILATSYRLVISVAAAGLTARLAPARPMRHALILGAIGTALGAIGAAVTWNKGLGPHWYPVALTVLALPQCWAGGKLLERSAAPGA